MRIFIFGVGQVGKSTISKALAEKLGLDFVDLDFIIMDKYKSIENFMQKYPLRERRFKRKADIVLAYREKHDQFVMAVSPIYSILEQKRLSLELTKDIAIALVASPETIFDRLGFYDEDAKLLPDSDMYKQKYKDHYMNEIFIDCLSNNREFSFYEHINTDGKSVNEVVNEIIEFINK